MLNLPLFESLKSGGPLAFHLINIILFYLNCIGTFILISILTKNNRMALLGSILFCIHPINAEIVGHITLNIILVFSFFAQLSFIFFWLSLENVRRTHLYYSLSLLAFAAALLCIELALLFPLFIGSALFFLRNFRIHEILKRCWPYFVLSLLYLLLWIFLVGPSSDLGLKIRSLPMDVFSFIATQFHLLGWYIANLFIPRDPVFIRNLALVNTTFWYWPILFCAFLAGIALMGGYWRRQRPFMAFAWTWFWVGFLILPVATFQHSYMGLVIEPYWFYFSSFGFFFFLSVYFIELIQSTGGKAWFVLILALSLFWISQARIIGKIGKTEKSYCQYWLAHSPHNAIALMALGKIHTQSKEYDEALRYYQMILDFTSYRPHLIHDNMGAILEHLNRLPEAREHILRAIQLNPQEINTYNSYTILGEIYAKEHDLVRAEANFKKALSYYPSFIPAIHGLNDLSKQSQNKN